MEEVQQFEEEQEQSEHIRNQLNKAEKDALFAEEFLPHMDSLYNFGYYLAHDEEMAKDLLQETYLKAYRFIEYFQVGTNAKAWLLRIMKNSFINEYRKKSKAPNKVDIDDINQKDDIDDDHHVALDMRQALKRDPQCFSFSFVLFCFVFRWFCRVWVRYNLLTYQSCRQPIHFIGESRRPCV